MFPLLSLASIFNIEAGNYKHFSFSAENAVFVRNVIFAMCAGILLASLCTMYQRYVPGSFIRALLRAEAFSAENAKSISEIGFEKNIFIRFELQFGTLLLKHLGFTEENEKTSFEKFSSRKRPSRNARFYIPEELKYRAELRYETKGNGPLQFVLTAALTCAIAIILFKTIPLLLSFVDAIL
jgi:hypothetical protein